MVLHWFRRDLRLEDNHALSSACQYSKERGSHVQCIFIFDSNILSELENPRDRRVAFIHAELQRIQFELAQQGAQLWVVYGDPIVWHTRWSEDPSVEALYANRDYEPYAGLRDTSVAQLYAEKGKPCKWVKDHVLMEPHEVLKEDRTPYLVFTPYARKWKSLLPPEGLAAFPDAKGPWSPQSPAYTFPSLEDLGFQACSLAIPSREIPMDVLAHYKETRDFPGEAGTSRLSVHLRFGTRSIRSLARSAYPTHETYVNELIWRDFYQMILKHFPQCPDKAIKPAYDHIRWENNTEHFASWCQGETGYPLVDAGMRELNETGFMHNRVRMVVASFLTKHLLLDWRLGAAYFAAKLLDFDLASNVGGWQWASGSGCDAAPYFRIFNPSSQMERFDKAAVYVKKWVPEYGTSTYPVPIVDHKMARERALFRYKEGLSFASLM